MLRAFIAADPEQSVHARADGVAHFTKELPHLILIADRQGRIGQWPVIAHHVATEGRQPTRIAHK